MWSLDDLQQFLKSYYEAGEHAVEIVSADENLQKWGSGLIILGCGIAGWKYRQFVKYSHPQTIHPSYFKTNKAIQGLVKEIEPNGTLQVVHSRLLFKKQLRNVNLEGVNIAGHGPAWLQIVLKKEPVIFKPISQGDNAINCIVLKDQKDVAHQLVSLGMATVQSPPKYLLKKKLCRSYYRSLMLAEVEAGYKKAGIWAENARRLEQPFKRPKSDLKVLSFWDTHVRFSYIYWWLYNRLMVK